MVSKAKEKKEKNASRMFGVSLLACVISLIALVYTAWHDHYRDKEEVSRNSSVDKRLGKIETTIRLLTAITAPQLQHEVDENLRSSITAPTGLYKALASKAQMQIADLRELKAPISEPQAQAIAGTLQQSLEAHPDSPETWNTATEFVSYRSGSFGNQPELSNCFDQPLVLTKPDDPYPLYQDYHDCVFDLGDLAGAKRHPAPIQFKSQTGIPTVVLQDYRLRNVLVVYRGGPIIPFALIDCVNCRFDFHPTNVVPPPTQRNIIERLLASDARNVTFAGVG